MTRRPEPSSAPLLIGAALGALVAVAIIVMLPAPLGIW